MSRVTIRENEWLGTGANSICDVKLSAAQVNVLGKMESSWARGTLEWGKDRVRFAGFCGIIKIGADYFDILPKIATHKDSLHDRRIFIKMLKVVSGLQLKSGDNTLAEMQESSILDVFIDLFCKTIQDAARRGLAHAYTERSENLRVLRGKICIGAQLRHNLCHPERLFCNFEDFQEDNNLNRILKAALTIAVRHALLPKTRAFAQSLGELFAHVADVPTSQLQWKGLAEDRRFAAWKAALTQARWFIDGECPDVYSGTQDSMSILFNMSKLFESYVAIEVKQLLDPQGYSIKCQGPIGWLLWHKGRYCYKTIPDILVTREGTPRAILDTKWKMPGDNETNAGMSPADLHQMFAYAKVYKVSEVALIYPSSYGQVIEPGIFEYMDGQTSLHVIRVDIALCLDREEFRNQLYCAGLDQVLAQAEKVAVTPHEQPPTLMPVAAKT